MPGPLTTHDAEFRRMYDEHFAAVRSYCLRRLPVADANDAVSEVFLVAWQKRSSLSGDPLPWLYGVAGNVVRNLRRSSRRSRRLAARAQAEPVYPEPGADVVVVRNAADEALLDALRRLSERDQEILRLRAWEGLTGPQIADILGCSVAAAEKRSIRAVRRLESQLKTHPHAAGEEVSGEYGAA